MGRRNRVHWPVCRRGSVSIAENGVPQKRRSLSLCMLNIEENMQAQVCKTFMPKHSHPTHSKHTHICAKWSKTNRLSERMKPWKLVLNKMQERTSYTVCRNVTLFWWWAFSQLYPHIKNSILNEKIGNFTFFVFVPLSQHRGALCFC